MFVLCTNWCWFIHFKNGVYLFVQMNSSERAEDERKEKDSEKIRPHKSVL